MTINLDLLANLDRMREIASYDLFNPALRERLDAIARHCAQSMGQPVGMISIVLDTAQLIAGSYGVTGWVADAGGTPVEWSFCAHAVTGGTTYLVPDAEADPDHTANPAVRGEGIRTYAGVPLVAPSGHLLGTACVLGPRPRAYTEAEVARLASAAREAVRVLGQFRQTNERVAA